MKCRCYQVKYFSTKNKITNGTKCNFSWHQVHSNLNTPDYATYNVNISDNLGIRHVFSVIRPLKDLRKYL